MSTLDPYRIEKPDASWEDLLTTAHENPNTLVTGAQVGETPEQRPITQQMFFSSDLVEKSAAKDPDGTITASGATSYLDSIRHDAERYQKEYATSGQVYEDLKSEDFETRLGAERALAQQKEADLQRTAKQVSGEIKSFTYVKMLPPADPNESEQEKRLRKIVEQGGVPPWSAGQAYTTLMELRKDREKLGEQRDVLTEKQTSDEATQRAAQFKMGQTGSGYAEAHAMKLATEQSRQLRDYDEKVNDYLDQAMMASANHNIRLAESFRAEANRTFEQRMQIEQLGMAERQNAVKMQEYEDARLEKTFSNMLKAGMSAETLPEGYLATMDEKMGMPSGYAKGMFEAVSASEARTRQQEELKTFQDTVALQKSIAELEMFPLEKEAKIADLQAKLRSAQTATYSEMGKIFDVMEKVPQGMSINIGDASYFGIEGGMVFERDSAGGGRIAYRGEDGSIQMQNIGFFGNPADVETRYVNGQPVLVNKKTGQTTSVTVGPTASPGANTWAETFPDGTQSPFRGASDPYQGQCGAFCNDLYEGGRIWGNTLDEKLAAAKQYEVSRDDVRVNDSFVMTGGTTGHVGIINDIYEDDEGVTYLKFTESNAVPPNGGTISNSRTMRLDDKKLLTFARIPLDPAKAPTVGSDSSWSDAGAKTGAAPDPWRGTSNPFVAPNVVMTAAQMKTAEEKWDQAKAAATDLMEGAKPEDVFKGMPYDVRNAAMREAKLQGFRTQDERYIEGFEPKPPAMEMSFDEWKGTDAAKAALREMGLRADGISAFAGARRADGKTSQDIFLEEKYWAERERYAGKKERGEMTRDDVEKLQGLGLGSGQIEQVQGILSGRVKPPTGTARTELQIGIVNGLSAMGYDLAQAELDWNGMKKRVNTLNSVDFMRLSASMSNLQGSTMQAERLFEEWKRIGKTSGVKSFNSANLKLAQQGAFGKDAASAANTLISHITDMSMELAVVYKGGGTPTDKGLEAASKSLDATWDEKSFRRNVELIRENMLIRQNTFDNLQYDPENRYSVEPPGGAVEKFKSMDDILGIR